MTSFRPITLRFDSLPSTNTEAARQATNGAPEGLCIVAREQTQGRGRQQRTWVSPMDAGLYFSIVLRPRLEIKAWPLITLMAALAVADALKEACALDVDIKWPNDILVGERKLCGILAETVETQIGRAAIVGIGINLQESAVPPELHERAIAIESVTGTVPDGEAVLRALVRAIGCRYARLLADDGPQVTLRAWAEHSSYATGKRVTVALGSETLTGITRGLEKDGALRVETAAGEIKVVHAGDVTALRVTGNS